LKLRTLRNAIQVLPIVESENVVEDKKGVTVRTEVEDLTIALRMFLVLDLRLVVMTRGEGDTKSSPVTITIAASPVVGCESRVEILCTTFENGRP
jgi:hypothetical protein